MTVKQTWLPQDHLSWRRSCLSQQLGSESTWPFCSFTSSWGRPPIPGCRRPHKSATSLLLPKGLWQSVLMWWWVSVTEPLFIGAFGTVWCTSDKVLWDKMTATLLWHTPQGQLKHFKSDSDNKFSSELWFSLLWEYSLQGKHEEDKSTEAKTLFLSTQL